MGSTWPGSPRYSFPVKSILEGDPLCLPRVGYKGVAGHRTTSQPL